MPSCSPLLAVRACKVASPNTEERSTSAQAILDTVLPSMIRVKAASPAMAAYLATPVDRVVAIPNISCEL